MHRQDWTDGWLVALISTILAGGTLVLAGVLSFQGWGAAVAVCLLAGPLALRRRR